MTKPVYILPKEDFSIPMLDSGNHTRAKIGFILLATEQTIQDDVFKLRPEGVGVHFTRAPNPDSITVEVFSNQASTLADAAATLFPIKNLNVICYACTSGSIVIGESRIFRELEKGAPGTIATSLITSVVRALRILQATNICVATPYLDEINQLESEYLKSAGFNVLDIQGLGLEHDSDMVRVSPKFVMEFSASIDRPDADALFISCGALRSLDIVEALEQKLGKPVVVSNQAMIWDTLRLAGINDQIDGYGALLRSN